MLVGGRFEESPRLTFSATAANIPHHRPTPLTGRLFLLPFLAERLSAVQSVEHQLSDRGDVTLNTPVKLNLSFNKRKPFR